jgi:hypothetical protein
MYEPSHVTVSEVATRLHTTPRAISDLLYKRILGEEECPIVGGRRMIPTSCIPRIEQALKEAGKLPVGTGAAHAAS